MPEGIDVMNIENYNANAHLLDFKNYITPFLAHAIGTFMGAFVCTKMAVDRKLWLAMLIGILFFVGGAMEIYERSTPMWFILLDLIFAYFPMAYIAYYFANKNKNIVKQKI